MGTTSNIPPNDQSATLDELRKANKTLDEINAKVGALSRSFDDFCRVFLAAKFPHGVPDDRFARPRSQRWRRS